MLVPLTSVIMHTPWEKIPNTKTPQSIMESKQKCVYMEAGLPMLIDSSRAREI